MGNSYVNKYVAETPNTLVESKDVVTPGIDSLHSESTTIAIKEDDKGSKHSFASSVAFSRNQKKEGHAAWESERSYATAEPEFLNKIRGGHETGFNAGEGHSAHSHSSNAYGGHGGYGAHGAHGGAYGAQGYSYGDQYSNSYGHGHAEPTYENPW